MNNPLDTRLLWVSLLLHIVALFSITFFDSDSSIRKRFVAYGRHSKKITNAYFRRLCAPKGGYEKYFQSRVAKKKSNKQTKKKPIATKKQQVKKTPVQPKKQIQKKVQKKTPEKKKKNIEKKRKESKKEKKKEEEKEKIDEKDNLSKEEILHFNLMGETDPRVIMYQQCIQVEVDRVWRPPLGVPKGTECEVYFVIAHDGSIKEFTIQKSSKMLIYDLSIIRVGKEFTFDRCLWGKSFVVTFRQ